MSVLLPIHKRIVAASLMVVAYSLPSSAQTSGPSEAEELQTPPSPEVEIPAEPVGPDPQDESALLEALAEAEPAAAKRLDRQLNALWSKSGSASMDLLLKRGRDALEEQDPKAAIEHLTALTDHAPEFAEGFHARASAFYAIDLYGPALDDLERALSLNPRNYNAIFGLGAVLETVGMTEMALDAYQRALALHPHHEDVTEAVKRLKPKIKGSTL